MENHFQRRRRRELPNRRFHLLSGPVNLALVVLFVLFTSLFSHHFTSLLYFDYSTLYSPEIHKSTLTGQNQSCRYHNDGGLPHAGCIRLLRINQTDDGGRYVHFEIFPLASAPRYHALSYTWGEATGKPTQSSSSTFIEYYKGEPMPRNLLDAIFRLGSRSVGDNDYGNWYWIDYLCIAQNNTRERGEQVSNMHRIYQQAESVDIWLGPASNDEAFRVSEILRFVLSHANSPCAAAWRKARKPAQILHQHDWDTLTRFFSRRWFHRLWTLQEFALAGHVRIMLGDEYIDSDLLWRAAKVLYDRGTIIPLDYGHNHSVGYAIVQHSILRECVEDPETFLSLLPTFATWESQLPDYETVLAWVFWRSAATLATDARDYVYGILGIADVIMNCLVDSTGCHIKPRKDLTASHCPPAYTPIKPDYNLDTAQVFQNFIVRLMHSRVGIRAMTLMHGGGDIGTLRQGRERQRHAVPTWIDREKSLPSWVPSLAYKNMLPLSSGGEPLVVFNETQHHTLLRAGSLYNIFGTLSNMSYTQRFYIVDDQVHLFGRRIGVVKNSSTPLPYAAQLAPCFEFAFNSLALLADAPPQNLLAGDHGSGVNAVESLLGTLGLGSWEATTSRRNESKQKSNSVPKAEQMQVFFAEGLNVLYCAYMSQHSYPNKPLDVWSFLSKYDLSKLAEVSGLSADFLERQIAKWMEPEMVFKRTSFMACLRHGDLFHDYRQHFNLCETLVSQFHWARGRSISSIVLESQLVEDHRAPLESDNHHNGNTVLLGLGPSNTIEGDEIWAVQGSNWPLILRRRQLEDDSEAITGRRSGVTTTRGRWWWPWNRGVVNDSRLPVYELRGEFYVHGIMDGELGVELEQHVEEIIIS